MRVDRCNVGGIPDVLINNNVTYLNNKPQKRKRAKNRLSFFVSDPERGAGKTNAHKPQNTIQTNKTNNTRNKTKPEHPKRTRKERTQTERENNPKPPKFCYFVTILKKRTSTGAVLSQ